MEINEGQVITLNVSEGGSGSEVSKAYVDAQNTKTLSSAKAYTDETVPTQVVTYLNEHKSELKGDKGDKGEQGIQGIQGERGLQGLQGLKGDTGEQGVQGIQGEKGADGAKGDKGEQGLQGIKGADGYSPVRTVDYWTDEDVASMKAYIDEQILGGKW